MGVSNRRSSRKARTRFTGFDDKIVSMYGARHEHARDPGTPGRDLPGGGGPTLISNVTEAVMEEVKSWQSRPLDGGVSDRVLTALVVEDSRDRDKSATRRSTW